jgi:hypothetical protein
MGPIVDELKKLQEEKNNKYVIVFEDGDNLSNTSTVSYSLSEKGKQPISIS